MLFFDPVLAQEFEWRVKQAGQLNSKMRLVTAPWLALLEDDVWLKNARHANAMAQRLAGASARGGGRAADVPGARPTPCSPRSRRACRSGCARKGWRFYTFLGETGCRLMCAWDMTAERVDRFADDLKQAANA